jgi:hypothetical protein
MKIRSEKFCTIFSHKTGKPKILSADCLVHLEKFLRPLNPDRFAHH